MEATRAAQIEDQQQWADKRNNERDVARPPHRRAMASPAEDIGQPANQRDPAAQSTDEHVERDEPLPGRLLEHWAVVIACGRAHLACIRYLGQRVIASPIRPWDAVAATLMPALPALPATL